MLLWMIACTGALPEDKTSDDSTPDSAVDSPVDTAPPGPFTLRLPAATSSEGLDHAAECEYTLSVDYECYNANPELRWENVPADAAALVLVFDDPDANGFDHWAVVNLPVDGGGLDAGISGQSASHTLPGESYELRNGFGFTGYLGSCPPSEHVYRWRMWAISEPLPADLTRFGQVEAQAEALSLGLAETCHIYGPATN